MKDKQDEDLQTAAAEYIDALVKKHLHELKWLWSSYVDVFEPNADAEIAKLRSEISEQKELLDACRENVLVSDNREIRSTVENCFRWFARVLEIDSCRIAAIAVETRSATTAASDVQEAFAAIEAWQESRSETTENVEPTKLDVMLSELRETNGRRYPIVQFLADNNKGVTFSEFTEARFGLSQYRLTDTDNPASIQSMLHRHSVAISKYGYQIKASTENNLIQLKERQF